MREIRFVTIPISTYLTVPITMGINHDTKVDSLTATTHENASNRLCKDSVYKRWQSGTETDSSFSTVSCDEEGQGDHVQLLPRKNCPDDNAEKADWNAHRLVNACTLFRRNFFPDGPLKVGEIELLEIEGVKLLKFFLLTFIEILIVHYYAKWTVRISSLGGEKMKLIAHFLFAKEFRPR